MLTSLPYGTYLRKNVPAPLLARAFDVRLKLVVLNVQADTDRFPHDTIARAGIHVERENRIAPLSLA